MKNRYLPTLVLILGAAATLETSLVVARSEPAVPPSYPIFTWVTVANDNDLMPGSEGRTFNSFNQPSVNTNGLVVMRARSRGGGDSQGAGSGGEEQGNAPTHGIYSRDMGGKAGPITRILDRTTEVPWPNNLGATFGETPSFPRIAKSSDAIATRGNHRPVWEFTLNGERTRTGTTGIYTDISGQLLTAAGKLGDVEEFSFFEVPGTAATRFEVFPGAPAVTDSGIIAFKGNYVVPDPQGTLATVGKTGVFYRRVEAADAGGYGAIQLVANSDTLIPNPGNCPAGTTFGSTAPPSAADRHMVFVGLDNEDDPACGGIYLAPLAPPPGQLTTLVGLETKVPGQGGAIFTRLGEGLSYDGRFVAFWGAWGEETKTIRLYCPEEGNRIRLDFCNNAGQFAPDQGDPNSICDDPDRACYQEKEVPLNQGIFVYDTAGKGKLWQVAMAGRVAKFDDFLYWNYSGAPPGSGEEDDGEPPRWRSAAFVAVSQRAGATFRAAFLARQGDMDPATQVYDSPVDGIYLAEVHGVSGPELTLLLQTGSDGTILDPEAVDPATNLALPITSLALERESLRGRWLAISASMGNEEAGWAGTYLTRMPVPPANKGSRVDTTGSGPPHEHK